VELRGDSVQWSFDDQIVKTFTTSQLVPGAVWSFGYPMHLIVNLAIGGYFAGSPVPSTFFPEHFVIDYIRASTLS
jgi:beta-glucanase (GH16 family)